MLDGIFFFKLLPLYKQYFRGPTHPFEHLEEELKSKAGWPPIGDCKNNEIKIAVTLSSTTNNPGSYGTTSTIVASNPDAASQAMSSSIALRDHLKMASKDVKQSIKNRWSGGGGLTDGSNDRSGGGLDEEVGLLHGAAEVPFESPLPYRSGAGGSAHQHQQSSSDCNINSPSAPPSYDSTQLQRTINRTFMSGAESSMLSSETTATTAVSPGHKKETTIC